jgi:hypothetical protein
VDQPVDPKPARRRGLWGALGYLVKAPAAAFCANDVAAGARTVVRLANVIKASPQRDPRIVTEDENRLDLPAIAYGFATSDRAIERMLRNRRRQTVIETYSYLAGGCAFLVLWVVVAIRSPVYASLGYVLGLLAICLLFFLSAFRSALVNWQCRTRRLGTARDFLDTTDSWWPS